MLKRCKGCKMSNPIVRVAAATVVAGAIAFAITTAPAADGSDATASQGAAPTQLTGKAERFGVPVRGVFCSQQGWLNFEPKCQFDSREPADQPRTGIIALQ
jgi:hypothetical protein